MGYSGNSILLVEVTVIGMPSVSQAVPSKKHLCKFGIYTRNWKNHSTWKVNNSLDTRKVMTNKLLIPCHCLDFSVKISVFIRLRQNSFPGKVFKSFCQNKTAGKHVVSISLCYLKKNSHVNKTSIKVSPFEPRIIYNTYIHLCNKGFFWIELFSCMLL